MTNDYKTRRDKAFKKWLDGTDMYGISPEIYSIDEEEGVLLCSKIVIEGSLTKAKEPYLYVRIGLEKFV